MGNYATLSIETHLFFARIMKEHSLFLEVGFPCKDKAWIQKADWFRQQFEEFLREVIKISDGNVGEEIVNSQELVTKFTISTEKKTSCLTGVPIDSRLSEKEKNIRPGCDNSDSLNRMVRQLNERGICLLNGLIDFKENILKEVKACRLFTVNYPLLIEHIIREAKLYRATLRELEQNKQCTRINLRVQENFWNRIMMEHALFIRGLLDPTEVALIETADGFAMDYEELLEMARTQDCKAMDELTRKSLEETLKYREFKTAGTKGIVDCEITSIILPLLADHVLREANHYIRILESV